MPINITMPALSPTMEEGNLTKWLVKEGDKVGPGDVIAEIETDKATMEVEAVDEGVVAKLVVPAGSEAVKVNAVIAILAAEGEDVGEAAKGGDAAPAKAEAKAEAPKQETAKADAPKEAKTEAAPAKAEKPVADQGPAPSTPAPVSKDGERIFASPLARRLAKEAGLDLSAVSGSGPHGRIVKTDVEKAASSGGAKAAPATAPSAGTAAPAPAKGPSDENVLKLFAEGSYELLPHDGMRKTIASRLTESTQTVPSYTVSMECELDAMLKLRAEINNSAPVKKTEKGEVPAFKLSVNDFIIKAMALALRDVPMANASWTSTARVLHKHADVGVAVSIPDGLITPIVRNAETKTLSAISNEVKDLAKRARDKKLKPEEYQGGTTSVSNLGMFGVSSFTSIVNLPQASIVSIGAGVEKPVVRGGKIEVGTVMTATFAFDHRVIDGALGAELASAFKRYIENPMGMLV
ncbi:pyruvate dehydrogenase complex dihydrolipoamide acetyltransferase [Agrobacterium rubi]|uniref:Acetyltransferase component of pyruvate dehydrogenase complex n=1 Tax=Agrobacterium rubi TaxID=28099 RepID=A0AAE7R2K8_9HYPH|nr:pyruvate dehydrogenase complex dihydrolipoamide acetyltransferase [Agrobacterium rubi]NTE86417.1 pyruvate dehydrogenase complex dihydrolipoamide acetyltransferase [Agrobacterium rubi]NTF02349.1 pyruvate dehydrogenase complex dihydrolipoamide acetyltransferase [Agrobacterium rubi]NTF36593.1 pyruvate dehydrogenase complex dihydrolipoamide acetyltransferase [Agrobacterium rubi]OCJ55760.1 pyruvate dehydrogenase complex dihydrolipoamide acetyltransferase [Agrobacterium rubi]QTF99052.1 pyruvate d